MSEPGGVGSIKCFSCAMAEPAAARMRTAIRRAAARISDFLLIDLCRIRGAVGRARPGGPRVARAVRLRGAMHGAERFATWWPTMNPSRSKETSAPLRVFMPMAGPSVSRHTPGRRSAANLPTHDAARCIAANISPNYRSGCGVSYRHPPGHGIFECRGRDNVRARNDPKNR